jgi:hypothetical protein
MRGVPFLETKVIEKLGKVLSHGLLHKKTDTQSYSNRVSV